MNLGREGKGEPERPVFPRKGHAMEESLKVYVVEFGDRRHYQMQYVDPVTGKKKTRSTCIVRTGRKKDRTEAERVAAKWEAELREGRYCAPSKITWAEFRERYEMEALAGLADGTFHKVGAVFSVLERVLNPLRLADVTAARLSHYQAELRRQGRSEDTIASHLAHIKAALSWAVKVGMLAKAPKIEKPRRAKGSDGMKGRPITTEEFERMLAKVDSVVGDKVAISWVHLLEGLWWSGLRLGEALDLWWDRDDRLRVLLAGEESMFRIRAEHEKGHRNRILPMAPDFAEFLERTPFEKREGRVFTPSPRRPGQADLSLEWVSRTISRIGERAGVVVETNAKTGKKKYASAHDLRRSFGQRWASHLMPSDLMVLMRHRSISVTMNYYVGVNAQGTAKKLWATHREKPAGNILANSDPIRPDSDVPGDDHKAMQNLDLGN